MLFAGSAYKSMLRNNFLPMPSIATLQRYIANMRPAYGFQESMFAMLRKKSQEIADETFLRGKNVNIYANKKATSICSGKRRKKYSLLFTGSIIADEVTLKRSKLQQEHP